MLPSGWCSEDQGQCLDCVKARTGNVTTRVSNLKTKQASVVLATLMGLLAGCHSLLPPEPAPSPEPSPTSMQAPPSTAALPTFPDGLKDAKSGLIYVEVEGAVLKIDLHRHHVQQIATPRLAGFRSFVATRDGLTVKQVDDGVGYTIATDNSVHDLPAALSGHGRLYRAGPDALWVVSEDPTHGRSSLAVVDTSADPPTVLARRSIPAGWGIPWSDSAGSLLAQAPTSTMVVTRSSTTRLAGWRKGWELIAVGPRSVLVRTCTHCRPTEIDRPHGKQATATSRGLRALDDLTSAQGDTGAGLMSTNGHFVAVPIVDRQHQFRLAIVDLIAGDTTLLQGAITKYNANDQFVWLPQDQGRWLLAVTDQTLRIFDTHTGAVTMWRDDRAQPVTVIDAVNSGPGERRRG